MRKHLFFFYENPCKLKEKSPLHQPRKEKNDGNRLYVCNAIIHGGLFLFGLTKKKREKEAFKNSLANKMLETGADREEEKFPNRDRITYVVSMNR